MAFGELAEPPAIGVLSESLTGGVDGVGGWLLSLDPPPPQPLSIIINMDMAILFFNVFFVILNFYLNLGVVIVWLIGVSVGCVVGSKFYGNLKCSIWMTNVWIQRTPKAVRWNDGLGVCSFWYWPDRTIRRTRIVPRTNERGTAALIPPFDQSFLTPADPAVQVSAIYERESRVDVTAWNMKVWGWVLFGKNLNF